MTKTPRVNFVRRGYTREAITIPLETNKKFQIYSPTSEIQDIFRVSMGLTHLLEPKIDIVSVYKSPNLS